MNIDPHANLEDGDLILIERKIWGTRAAAYIQPARIDIYLPEWSGLLTRAATHEGIADLRNLFDRIEAVIRAIEETAT